MTPIQRLAQRARLVAAGRGGDVPSPCVSICRMSSATELCIGCFRTLDEIALWGRMDDASKHQVWRSIAGRIEQHVEAPE
jgi:predicted Fe-S protein YdhL (DUF1289 family)